MTRPLKLGLALALGAAAISGVALAHGPWEQHLEHRVDAALDAVKATPAQRVSVKSAVEHVMTTFAESHQTRGGDFERALALFEADGIDQAVIARVRTEHEAQAKKTGDAVVQALFDVHDALTPAQRRELADWVRAQKAEHAGGKFGPELFKKMISSRIDDALDAVKANPAQLKVAHAARDRVFQVFEQMHQTRGADMDRALAIFTADKLDPKAIEALRTEHFAQMKRAGDAVVQALTELHGALDAGQRRSLVEWVKTHRGPWGHHG